ncbi:hypothetical protein FKM82_027763 [Ascaphus truei]
MSRELQSAMGGGGEALCAGGRSYSLDSISSRSQGSGHSQDSATPRPVLTGHMHENLGPRVTEGTDQTQRPFGIPNGCPARPEPPVPPPKPPLKRRSLSVCRYTLSDGEEEEVVRDAAGSGALGSYATLTRRPGRCTLPNGQSERKVLRSQSFAVRARRKGPPPPPPKRLSSMSSAEAPAAEGHSSVKSMAARLEELGGAAGVGPSGAVHTQVSESEGRRRTVSESAAGLGGRLSVPLAARREDEERKEEAASQHSSSESLPFAEEGNLTIKQRPKPPGAKPEPETKPLSGARLQTGVKPQPGAKPNIGPKPQPRATDPGPIAELDFHLEESDTVKRRPKVREAGCPQEESLEHPQSDFQPREPLTEEPRPPARETVGTRVTEVEWRLLSSERGREVITETGSAAPVGSQSYLVVSGPQLVLQKPAWGVSSPAPLAGSVLWGIEAGAHADVKGRTPLPDAAPNADLGARGYTSLLHNPEGSGAEDEGRNR